MRVTITTKGPPMPNKMWRHDDGRLTGRDCDESGDDCVERNVFAGWHLGMHESMARYQYSYGLKPIGPHRRMADELLGALRTRCARCDYRGILDIDGGVTWSPCPVCEATGGFWTASDEEVAAVRADILKTYPDAAAPPVRFLGVPLALAVPTNTMVDLRDIPLRRAAFPRPRRKPTRRSGSPKTLSGADVERAFAEAQRQVGMGLKLKGWGHCRRVSLAPQYASWIVKGAGDSVAWVWVRGSWLPLRVIPRVVVERAARSLGVPPGLFIHLEC
jgi:hypothetical protein